MQIFDRLFKRKYFWNITCFQKDFRWWWLWSLLLRLPSSWSLAVVFIFTHPVPLEIFSWGCLLFHNRFHHRWSLKVLQKSLTLFFKSKHWLAPLIFSTCWLCSCVAEAGPKKRYGQPEAKRCPIVKYVKRWENTIKPKYQIAKGGKIDG